ISSRDRTSSATPRRRLWRDGRRRKTSNILATCLKNNFITQIIVSITPYWRFPPESPVGVHLAKEPRHAFSLRDPLPYRNLSLCHCLNHRLPVFVVFEDEPGMGE
ncbi:hypothetical protein ACC694_37595, partial [Rhizobium ruizarguesonis]